MIVDPDQSLESRRKSNGNQSRRFRPPLKLLLVIGRLRTGVAPQISVLALVIEGVIEILVWQPGRGLGSWKGSANHDGPWRRENQAVFSLFLSFLLCHAAIPAAPNANIDSVPGSGTRYREACDRPWAVSQPPYQ